MSGGNADLEAKVALLARELAEARMQQSAAADVLRVISGSNFDLDEVLTHLIRSGIGLCEAARGVIWLKRGGRLFLAAQVGYAEDWVAFAKSSPITPAADALTTSGIAAFTGEVVHVEDVPNDPRFRSLAAHKLGDYRAGLAVPLKRGDQVVGVISLSRPEARLFTDQQVALVRTFADQAVIAIENVRLFDEAQARTREVSEALEKQTATSEILRVISKSSTDVQPVFETIAESAARLCAAQFCFVYRFDGSLVYFMAHHGLPPEAVEAARRVFPMAPSRASAGGRAILTGDVAQIPDLHADAEYTVGSILALNSRSTLAVPMLRGGIPVGAIALDRAEAGYFPMRQIELLQTFADQAVIAIENARLFEEVQARTAELTEALEQQVASSAILRAIAASPTDIQPVLDAVTESAAQLCNAIDATIFLHRGDVLAVAAHHGSIPIDFANLPISRDLVTSRAFLDRVPVHVHDVAVAGDEFASARENALRLGFRTVLSTPLMREGIAIGALMIRRAEVSPFSAKQIELLKTFADQAVIAIENVRLFDEVQLRNRSLTQSLEQQTATSDILRVLSMSPTDVRPVFETIVRNAVSLCGSLFANVFQFDGEELRFVASHNVGRDYVELLRAKYPMRPDHSQVAGRVLLTRSVVRIEDVLADPDYDQRFPSVMGWRRMLGVPLLREGEPLGVIVVGWAETGPVPKVQEDLLKTFADQAVIAIENVRLFEEVQARTAELGEALQQQTATADVLKVISRSAFDLQAVLDTLAESAARLCEADMVDFYRSVDDDFQWAASFGAEAEPDRDHTTIMRQPGRGSVSGRVLLERRTVHVPDFEADAEFTFVDVARKRGVRAILGVPLLRGDALIGLLLVMRKVLGPFTSKQVELAETFADQAVIAIENVRLFEEVQAKTQDLEESLTFQKATNDVLEVIGRSASDRNPVLKAIVDTAADLCRADMAVVRLVKDGALHAAAASSRNDPEVVDHMLGHPELQIDRSSVAGRVTLEGGTIHIPDIAADKEYTYLSTLGRMPFGAALGVPLFQDGKVAGVIILLRQHVDPFTGRQIALVQTFADQAVIAIENARLFEVVQARTAELAEALQQQTATADVLKVISRSAFDLGTVLETLIASACQLCNAEMGLIFLAREGSFSAEASHGVPPGYLEFMRTHPLKPGRETFTGRAALTKAVVNVADALEDKEFTFGEARDRAGYRAMLAVPLLRQGEVIGVFAMPRSAPGAFSDKQVELVQTFADQAVIAIENVRLFEEVQARTEEVSRSLEELRTAQDRLVQTEKLASLGQLTAGIAHEIKNPLNFVNNFSALSGELIDELREVLAAAPVDGKLRAEIADLTQMLKGNLEKVVQHGKRADSIVKNMLLHSREGSGEHRQSDINAIVEESLNLAYHGARAEKQGFNVTMEKSLDPAAGEIDLFPQEITRVLLNLISNGFYAVTKRKAAADQGYEPTLAAATRNLGDSVEIRIRDNGTGIPPEVKEKMFNPFFTTKPAGEGTGLGLSLSHDIIVKQHAGMIEVESEPGVFTEFRIVLPRGAASLGEEEGRQ